MPRPKLPLEIGRKIGSLTLLEEIPGINPVNFTNVRRRGRFLCDCGRIVERDINGWRYNQSRIGCRYCKNVARRNQ